MKNTLFFTIFLVITVITTMASGQNNTTGIKALRPKSVGEIIEHTHYTLAYSEMHEQAIWVYYLLTPIHVERKYERTDDFRSDPKVSTRSATTYDYRGSGIDRGHLCPPADMQINKNAVSETFFMSNISPQVPDFNRNAWNTLEQLVRQWTKTEDSLYVVTGPVFRNNKGHIGSNKVTVPGYFYKVIFDPTGKKKMIAFLMKNSEISQNIKRCAVSVDSIENLTGIDFFAGMPNDIENQLERKSIVEDWNFKFDQPSYQKTTNPKQGNTQKSQCKGIAKSTGKRCRTLTPNKNGYCDAHQKQVPKK
ncbi:MAG: DNA/RNA non-specific endonuclease [Bacteroidales bacterium]|nr:DNA/RNA non-specific endonuclease [Bacteroidales bacterium]